MLGILDGPKFSSQIINRVCPDEGNRETALFQHMTVDNWPL